MPVSSDYPTSRPGRRAGWMLTVTLTELRREVVVCTVLGEIDMTTAPVLADKLKQAIRPGQARHLLIDMSGVTFIGSHGLLALVEARRAHHRDHLFALVAPSAATRLALAAIGLADLFPHYDELDVALGDCRPAR